MKQKGFTLVELAIVITIIGLLIGGVLKGQELLDNARMTSSVNLQRAYQAATTTFKDIYKAFPGDLASPANFLQNCTTSPCNISGNADGAIGPVYTGSGSYYNDENNNYWLHLAKAGLASGIDPNSTWTSGTYFAASVPDYPLGGKVYIVTYSEGTLNGGAYNGVLWLVGQPASGGASIGRLVPINTFAKLDLKVDDGKPWSGTHLLNSAGCGIALTDTNYNPNITTPCTYNINSGIQ